MLPTLLFFLGSSTHSPCHHVLSAYSLGFLSEHLMQFVFLHDKEYTVRNPIDHLFVGQV